MNLLETLVQHGEAPIKDATGNIIASHWRDCDGDAVEIRDNSGLLRDAIAAVHLEQALFCGAVAAHHGAVG